MGQEVILNEAIEKLLEYWKKQKISSKPNSVEKIEETEKRLEIELPDDFKILFLRTNGLKDQYPNYTDKEGFLFYPLEFLIRCKDEFNETNSITSECILFMNYLHKSWWFGVLIDSKKVSKTYSIVIIPNSKEYKVITNSLSEFIKLYIEDREELYNHSNSLVRFL
jgi:hypothetical protein